MITIPVLIILTLYVIATYNGLVRLRNGAKRSFATIDVMLKKRHDLIPNLIASVKQLMKHETALFQNITELRAAAISSSSMQRAEAEAQLGVALGQLMVSMESYPDLKSDRNVMQLQAALNEIEEQIGASRTAYNAAVTRFNTRLETFPSSMVGKLFGFTARELFEANATERSNVNVEQLFNS